MINSKEKLKEHEKTINNFLKDRLKLELHPDKCKINSLSKGTKFLGFRVFYYYKIPLKRNLRKIKNKLIQAIHHCREKQITATDVFNILQGWFSYAMHGNTHNLRKTIHHDTKHKLLKLNSLPTSSSLLQDWLSQQPGH